MSRYEEDEYDDYLDEYEDEGVDQEEEEAGEEEYEDEEPPQPSQELEFLELRQRLKEDIRKQRKKELGSGSHDIKKSASSRDNFGSFFGPSQPVISNRVIQESKLLLENPNLAAKVMKSSHSQSNKSVASKPAGSKASTSNNHAPKVKTGVILQSVQFSRTLHMYSWDYSFLLSDDAELPGPSRGSLTQKVSAPYCDARLVQRPSGKQTSSDIGRKLVDDREVKRGSQIQQKAVIQKSMSNNKPTQPTLDSRKQFSSSNGSGPGRSLGPKGVPPKVTGDLNDKKFLAPGTKSTVSVSNRPLPSRVQSAVPKQSSVQKRIPNESGNSKVMSKQGVPVSKPQIQKQQASMSRPQIKPPPARNLARPLDDRRPTFQQRDSRRPAPQQRDDRRPALQQRDDRRPALQQRDDRRPALQQRDERRPSLQQRDDRRPSLQQRDDRRPAHQRKDERRPAPQQKDDRRPALHRKDDRWPVRKPMRYDEEDDGEEAISMIRKMFGYNPNRYRDDDDDSDMEANFDEILKEERRSAKIAREEDEEELRKIEEEERRERLRKQAKKRKLSHQ
ncbi:protein SPT2 isoform X1 [Capsicum galapagoense]